MKNFTVVLIVAIITLYAFKSYADVRIHKITVDFVENRANVSEDVGNYDQTNTWVPAGESQSIVINEPAFDQVISTLTEANALDLNAVVSVLSST